MVYQKKVQAVVLAAGRGSRMTQLIGTSVPKCLVPVCGNPLIFYSLKSLERAGFHGSDILVIIQEREDVRKALMTVTEQLGLQGVEILPVPEDSEDFGTAESLRIALLNNKITRDALIISVDTITSLPLREIFDYHVIKESELTATFISPLGIPEGVTLPGPKTKIKNERDIVGLQPVTDNLVFMTSEADCEEDIRVPVSMLKNCPHTKLLTAYTDSHIYYVKFSLLEKMLECSSEKNFLNFKGEFLPYLIQNQFSPDFSEYSFKMYACIQPEFNCIRVNSINSFGLANKSGDWIKEVFLDGQIPKSKCKIAKGVKLWGSSFGEGCSVEEKSKVTNTITLDGVVVKAGATVEGCLLSSGVVVGENAIIKNCLIGPKYQIPADGQFANEQLTVMEEAYFGE